MQAHFSSLKSFVLHGRPPGNFEHLPEYVLHPFKSRQLSLAQNIHIGQSYTMFCVNFQNDFTTEH